MNAFEYASPASVDAAVKALAGSESSAGLAGGTDLLGRIKDYVSSPTRVVYLKDIKDYDFRSIRTEDSLITLGAGSTLAQVIADETLLKACPALGQAALSVATPQIRAMATLAGNLLQRPRCWYYRSGFGLLGGQRDQSGALVRSNGTTESAFPVSSLNFPADGHLVRNGDNRYHAIFMTDTDALFVSPSNLAPTLIALGATAELTGPDGSRTVGVADLYQVPSTEDEREIAIDDAEVLSRVVIPDTSGKLSAHYEVRQKASHDWPLSMAAVALELDGEIVSKASIILGAVAPIPYRAEAAEQAIVGKRINPETAAAAGNAAVQNAKPLSKNAYKVPLTEVAVKRALLRAVGNPAWNPMEA